MPNLYKSECYCTNIRRACNYISAYYDRALNSSGLTIAQYYLVKNLYRLGSANTTQLAEYVGLERSTLVRNLKGLEARGLIEREPDNKTYFHLSSAGKQALELAKPLWNTAQDHVEEYIGKEDAEAILRIGMKLETINDESFQHV